MVNVQCFEGPLDGQVVEVAPKLLVHGNIVTLDVSASDVPHFIGKKILYRGQTTAKYIVRRIIVGGVKRWYALHHPS